MRIPEIIKKCVPAWVIVALLLALVFAILGRVALFSAPLSDFVNVYIATPLRAVMSAVTFIIPFSLFELILILLVPALITVIVLAIRDKRGITERVRTLVCFIGAIAILYSGYVAVMGIPYNTTPLADNLGISEEKDVTREELYHAIVTVRDKINELDEQISREGGVSVCPYTLDELSNFISREYESIRADYPFFYNFASRAKPVMLSGIMSDMGILGIYTYFTGEANVNISYPDYSTVFTVAHEFAHQRGINRENEANFMAFFVLSHSSDAYLQYSAYLNMYEYLASALNSTDRELYLEVLAGLSEGARQDVRASSELTRQHRESPLFKLMKQVNDAYLKSNGTPGVVSYGYVVRLAVSYLK